MDAYDGEEEVNIIEEVDRYRSGESKQEEEATRPRHPPCNIGASTNCTNFVCANGVSKITTNKLKSLAEQFCLSVAIMQPGLDDRLHKPPPRMSIFSEAIMWDGASISLHPFVEAVLDHFNLVSFQLNPNSLRTIVAILYHIYGG